MLEPGRGQGTRRRPGQRMTLKSNTWLSEQLLGHYLFLDQLWSEIGHGSKLDRRRILRNEVLVSFQLLLVTWKVRRSAWLITFNRDDRLLPNWRQIQVALLFQFQLSPVHDHGPCVLHLDLWGSRSFLEWSIQSDVAHIH